MMFLTKILLIISIFSILSITVTGTDSSQAGFVALLNSEIPITNILEGYVGDFVDLDDDNCD